jgi:hypothetical protein
MLDMKWCDTDELSVDRLISATTNQMEVTIRSQVSRDEDLSAMNVAYKINAIGATAKSTFRTCMK